MRQLYTAFYFLIFLGFLRELIRVVCPDSGTKKYCLYLNLPHYQRSIRLATSVSYGSIARARRAMIADAWNEDYLEIAGPDEPQFKPINLESHEMFNFYDPGTVNAITEVIRQYVKTPNM